MLLLPIFLSMFILILPKLLPVFNKPDYFLSCSCTDVTCNLYNDHKNNEFLKKNKLHISETFWHQSHRRPSSDFAPSIMPHPSQQYMTPYGCNWGKGWQINEHPMHNRWQMCILSFSQWHVYVSFSCSLCRWIRKIHWRALV